MKNNIALVGFAILLSAALTLSHGLLRSASSYPSLEYDWAVRIAPALFLYGLVFFLYTVLLRYYNISILYPVYTALSILGVSLIGVLYFGEDFSLYKIIGMIFLLIGITLLAA